MTQEWVVYSKPALARVETVVDYLGRYRHRIALSDHRLLDFDGESVALAYKDYRDGDRRKVMALAGEELIRRFLLHVLPKGFMRSTGLCGVMQSGAAPSSGSDSEYSA